MGPDLLRQGGHSTKTLRLPRAQRTVNNEKVLTLFRRGGAVFSDGVPTAHRGAGAQVEPVSAQRLQVLQGQLSGRGVTDVHRLQGPQPLRVVD